MMILFSIFKHTKIQFEMGLFDLFKNDTAVRPSFWKSLTSEEDLSKAIHESYQHTVVLFKHSTRCFISKSVLKSFENEVTEDSKNAGYYFLDLLKYRPLSNKIAQDFEITHQSPQMIVLIDGKAINHASHEAISNQLI